MPLYEYLCDACGHRFEVIQKFSDPPPERCPKCGGSVHKLQSAPAFQFKGTGWYVTDYARKDTGGGAQSSSKGAASASEGSSTAEKSDKADKKDQSGSSTKTEKSEKSPSAASRPSSTTDGT